MLLFHGVPDWVNEEEVFASDYALWWSPDSQKVAFLAFDETLVDEYVFPIYNPTQDSSAIIPYTTDVVMKYPKPGYNNPWCQFTSLTWSGMNLLLEFLLRARRLSWTGSVDTQKKTVSFQR